MKFLSNSSSSSIFLHLAPSYAHFALSSSIAHGSFRYTFWWNCNGAFSAIIKINLSPFAIHDILRIARNSVPTRILSNSIILWKLLFLEEFQHDINYFKQVSNCCSYLFSMTWKSLEIVYYFFSFFASGRLRGKRRNALQSRYLTCAASRYLELWKILSNPSEPSR